MDKNRLSETLNELHDALRQADTLNDEERQRLENLHAEIERKLEQGEAAGDDESFIDEWLNEIRSFEVSHPQITLALGHLLDILSQSGV